MVIAVVGSGGKTTLIHRLAEQYQKEGKRVFVTTSTHMFIEPDTLLTDDAEEIIKKLEKDGYVMAGIKTGEKIKALSPETYKTVSSYADITLVEADGSRHLPIKFPNEQEPVIYENVNEIIIVCGLPAIGHPLKDVTFRPELVQKCLNIPENTKITPTHIQKLIQKGYIEPMQKQYPDKELKIHPSHDGSLYQRAIAGLMEARMDVSLIKEEWFESKPCLFICGGGHVAHELAEFAAKLDFRVKIMDDRSEFANKDRYPMAEEVICDEFENLEQYLEPNSFYVVVTRGHQADFVCVKTILGTKYRYLGMIGSKKKVATTLERLRVVLKEANLPENLLETIHAPIGLKIGAVTPGEIAISILAEIIQTKNQNSIASASTELLHTDLHGMLCIIIEKTGSSPRGVGSMMLVTEDRILDSIGGGTVEFAAIEDARSNPQAAIREYHLNNKDSERLGMICGGSNKVLFIPV